MTQATTYKKMTKSLHFQQHLTKNPTLKFRKALESVILFTVSEEFLINKPYGKTKDVFKFYVNKVIHAQDDENVRVFYKTVPLNFVIRKNGTFVSEACYKNF